jgi:hypothetical protein
MTQLEKISYAGWSNVHRLSNDHVDLCITGDVGPRVIRFGFVGGANEFCEIPGQVGRTGGDQWVNYGGHRLWHAPEHPVRTYVPDNTPITVEAIPNGARTLQPTEALTGIQKEMEITLDPNSARVRVLHRLRNQGQWAVELAPWALSVMSGDGVAILPQPPKGSHPKDLLPATRLVLWPYTNMADPRWTWGNRFVLLRQDRNTNAPQKAGMMVTQGWAAYARGGNLFLKTFRYVPDAVYPDLGCTVETFTNHVMLEVETLGPLTTLAPGAAVEHEENWYLFRDVPMPTSDADVERDVLPKLASIH